MATLNLSENDWQSLAALAGLTERDFSTLRAALADAPPGTRKSFARQKAFAALPKVLRAHTPGIASVLVYLATFTSSLSISGIVRDVVTDIQKGNSPIQVEGDKIDHLSKWLDELLHIESVQTSAKASDLSLETTQFLQNVRILTDMRPAFADDGPLQVKRALILHTLKMQYFDLSGPKELY